MKEVMKRVWNEPAVFIGLLVSLALLVINLINGNIDATAIISILGPLLAALGIRQAVIPVNKLDELTAPAPTTYQKPTKV